MTGSGQELTARPVMAPKGGWGAYTQLSRELKEAGLLERRRGWYAARIGLNLALLAAGCAAFVLLGDSWWQLVTAAYLAVVFTQIAFLGHDAGHRQVFRSRRANDLVGLLHANLLVGVSFDWWVGKHNRHHSNPNHEDLDPDISISALAFTDEQASAKHGLVRLVARLPGLAVLPAAAAGGGAPAPASVKAIVRAARAGPTGSRRCCCSPMLAVYLDRAGPGAVAAAGGGVRRWSSRACSGCTWAARFAPNHKGMPTLDRGHQLDFLRRQVLTSRNVARQPLRRLPAGRAQLPDRAPSVPEHATAQPAPRPAAGAGVLRAARPGLCRGQPGRLLRRSPPTPPRRRRPAPPGSGGELAPAGRDHPARWGPSSERSAGPSRSAAVLAWCQ